MPNEAANQEQAFLIELLRAIYQNQEVYPILQHNLSKLNDNLAFILRKWVSDRFAKEPAIVIEGTDICLSSDNNKLILRETLTLGSNGSSNKTLNSGSPYLRTKVLTTNSVNLS